MKILLLNARSQDMSLQQTEKNPEAIEKNDMQQIKRPVHHWSPTATEL